MIGVAKGVEEDDSSVAQRQLEELRAALHVRVADEALQKGVVGFRHRRTHEIGHAVGVDGLAEDAHEDELVELSRLRILRFDVRDLSLEHVAGPLTYGSQPGLVELGEGREILPLGSQFFFDDVSQMKEAGHAGLHEDADESLSIFFRQDSDVARNGQARRDHERRHLFF